MADQLIEIVSNGDIMLTVTKADHSLSFKVHASFLREASPVFTSLLSPKFAEGQALMSNPSALCEINLYDDDPDCMQLALDVIHGKSKKLPQRVSAHQIVDLALIVDKYFLHEVMELPLDRWLTPTKHDDLYSFLSAAILLNHPASFSETTRLMLLHHATSYSKHTCIDMDASLLHSIISIDNRRDEIRAETLRELRAAASTSADGLCKHTYYIAKQFLDGLNTFEATTTGIRRVSLATAFYELSIALYVEPSVPGGVFCGEDSHYHPPPAILTQNYERVLEQVGRTSGLCLHCEQREKGEHMCKSGHPTWI